MSVLLTYVTVLAWIGTIVLGFLLGGCWYMYLTTQSPFACKDYLRGTAQWHISFFACLAWIITMLIVGHG